HHETAEAADLDSIPATKGLGHAVEHGVDDDLGIPPRVGGIQANDLVDQVSFRHFAAASDRPGALLFPAGLLATSLAELLLDHVAKGNATPPAATGLHVLLHLFLLGRLDQRADAERDA